MKKRVLSLLMVLAMLATLLPAGMVSVGAAEDITNIVCVGDSITAGSGSTGGYPYPTYLQNLLGSGYTVLNKGLSGRTMGDYSDGAQYTYKATDGTTYGNGTSAQVDQATIESADTIIIMLGTNDTKKTVDEFTDPFVSAYKTMIDTFAGWNSDVNFILATTPNSKVTGTNTWASADRLAAANALVKDTMVAYATEKTTGSVSLIDIYTEMADFVTDSTLWYDTVHPNYKGYEKLAGVFYEAFWDTTVHSFVVDGVDADNISIDTDAATIGIAAESVSGTATVGVAANSTADTVDLTGLTVESPITFTVTANYDGNSREWTVYLTEDTADFEKTLIYNADQLKALQGQALTGDYKLMADVDVSDINWTAITSLDGTFDGNGHTVTMAATVAANNYGFIKSINAGSTVKGLTMAGTIDGNAKNNIGVIAYENKGLITDCTNTATITNAGTFAYAAGIVAYNDGLVNNCANTAAISGNNNYTAGVVACLRANAVVANCYNTGEITIANNGAGGVVGDATAANCTVINCYNIGAVISQNTTDGRIIAGIVASGGNTAMTIQNCWSTGAITAKGESSDIGCRVTAATMRVYYGKTADAATAVAALNANLMAGVTYGDTLYDLNSWTATDGVPAFGEAVTAMPVDENGAYHLMNKDHFDWWVSAVKADASVSAVLECDITLTGEWTPIPTLTGTFDGGDHTISGLTITNATTAFQGFFADVTGGTVKNLNLTNVSISSSNTKVGGIAGRMLYGTVSNCSVSGTIAGTHEGGSSNIGGIVGEAGGNTSNAVVIEGCTNNANITITHANENDKNVAGIVGQAAINSGAGSVIRNCVNTGTITGVSTVSKKVAGIAGETYYSIVNCVNTGAVSGKADIGGIVGVSYNGNDPDVEGNNDRPTYIINCYNIGAITGSGNQGGIAGRVNMYSHMYNCYTTGTYGVYSSAHTVANTANNYYCSDTATTSKNGTGKTAADMQSADFVRVLNNYVIEKKDDAAFAALSLSKWAKGTDNYPVHTGELAGKDDVVDNTAQIETAAQLLAINGKSDAYTLANDITITAEDASAITTEYLINAFSGTLNGNGKTITIECNKMLIQFLYGTINNVTIKATINLPDNSKIAPFARYCYGGTMTNCTFDGSVTAKEYPSGIVVSVYSGAVIDNCRTTATSTITAVATSGYHYAAGIVSTTGDWGDGDIIIRNCVNEAAVNATNDCCGGIVSSIGNNCTIVVDNCSNFGTITGVNATAGIVASAEGSATLIVTNCQNNATVSGGNYVGGIIGRTQANLTLYVVNNSTVGTMSGTTGGVVQTIRGNVVAYLENNYTYNKQNMVAFNKSADTATINVSNTFAWWNAAGTNAAGYEQVLESTMKSVGFVLTLDSYTPSEAVQTVLTANNIILKTWDAVKGATPVLGTAAIGSKGGIKYDGETLLIGNELQLQYFVAQVASNAALSARLTANVALTENWTTIATAYTGTFDGDGYTISGFKQIDLANGNVGMFKELATAGVIKNLTLVGHIDCPNASNFGAIVATNNGLVYGCTNKVNIVDEDITRDEAGHLIVEGGKSQIGGVVGVNNGTVDSCVNEGIVTAYGDFVGGVVGYANAGSLIVNCSNSGEVAHTPEKVAGVDDSGSGTGGILGGAPNNASATAYVINSNNTGYVYDNNFHRGYIGGVIGDRGIAYNCYNTGLVWYKGNTNGGADIIGRIIADGTVTNGYGYNAKNTTNGSTKMELTDMQALEFALTLNENVDNIADTSFASAVEDVTLRYWAQGEDDLPVLVDQVAVKIMVKNMTVTTKYVASPTELAELLENPDAPQLGGYTWESWGENPGDAPVLFAANKDGMTITAVYAVDADAEKYAVTVENASATTVNGNYTSGDPSLTFDQWIKVTAELEEGKEIAYWELDGAKVGFGETTYKFYVSGNSTIKAVSKTDVEEAITPSVVLQQATSSTDGEKYNLTVIAQTSIPEDSAYTELSYGVYYTASTSALKALKEGTAAEGTYVQVESSKTEANQQYMTHLLGVVADRTRYAMAYMVVDGTVYYSTTVFQFKTTTDGVTIVKGAIE